MIPFERVGVAQTDQHATIKHRTPVCLWDGMAQMRWHLHGYHPYVSRTITFLLIVVDVLYSLHESIVAVSHIR